MKKFTSFIFLCVLVVSAIAQERIAISSATIEPYIHFSKGADTLYPISVINESDLDLYTTTSGGYACGTNEWGDLAKAQQFMINGTGRLIGCFVWVGEKTGSTGNVLFNAYNANGTGLNGSGANINYAPGTVIGTVSRPLSQINASYTAAQGLNYFEFPTPIEVDSRFYVGLDFSQMGAFPANKLGIVSSVDGGGMGLDMAWEKWNDGIWYSLKNPNSWGLDIDMMFIAIVEIDEPECDVHELPFFEDFETNSVDCWFVSNIDGGGESWTLTNQINHTPSGSFSAVHFYGDAGHNEDGLLMSPFINLPENQNIELSFWSFNDWPAYYGRNSVYISTDGGENFDEIWYAETVVDEWVETVLNLSEFAGETILIGFRYEGNDAHSWVLDDVKVEVVENECEDPVCPTDIIVCENDASFELSGAIPIGGVYSGEYVENNTFFPELAGAGTHIVTYTLTDGSCVTECLFSVIVNPIYQQIMPISICEGDTYNFSGEILTEAGEYTFELVSETGCDSLIIINLTVNSLYEIEIEATICQGDEYIYHGETLSEAGEYTFELTSAFGCDSVVVLSLIVNPVFNEEIQVSICEGEEYEFNGQLYAETGEYVFEGLTANGCDSTITLILTVHPTVNEVLEIALCDGDVYDFGETMITEAGEYTFEGITQFGCDSIVVLHITFADSYNETITANICEGDSYEFFGQLLTETGEYTEVVTGIGCDTIYTLNLTVHESITQNIEEVICEGEEFVFGGEAYSATGEYTFEGLTQFGCDSVVVLNLIVNPSYEITVTAEICEGETYEYGEELYSVTGEYIFEYQTNFGCDSIVTLVLTVHPIYSELIEVTICEGDLYEFAGEVYAETGEYAFEGSSIFGCDSIVILHLTVANEVSVEMFEAICEGEEFNFFGQLLTEAGEYSETVSGSACDTTYNLTLQVYPAYNEVIEAVICEDDVYEFNGEIYTESGEYTFEFITEFGCDSTITLHLVVDVCEYLNELNSTEITVYPNPVSEHINITLHRIYSKVNVSIKDVSGREIFSHQYNNVERIEDIQLNHASGIYIITIATQNEIKHIKIIKE